MSNNELIDLALTYVYQTDRAYLVSDADEIPYWLPKSRTTVEDMNNIDLEEGETYTFLIEEWLAMEKGLI